MKAPSDLGLKPDPLFGPDERLYRRILPDHISEDNHVMAAAVEDIKERHPSCSFNRGKYSNPQDVLDSDHPELSKIAFLVAGNLPEPVAHPSDPQTKFGFRLEHLPDEDNYSHSEVQVTKNATIASNLKNSEVRRHLREALADKMLIL